MPLPLLGYVHILTFFVPVVVAARRYKDLGSTLRLLSLLCLIAAANSVIGFALGRFGINNQPLANCFVVVEFVMVGLIFRSAVRSRALKLLFAASVIVFPAVWVLHQGLFADLFRMNTEMAVVSKALLVLLAVAAMGQMLSGDPQIPFGTQPVFWIATAVLLYSTGTFVVFGLGNYFLETNKDLFVAAWHMNWALIISSNLLFTKALLCSS
ncbi:MAG: hypothetical protein WEB37_04490 [Bacteroidota bacterium]